MLQRACLASYEERVLDQERRRESDKILRIPEFYGLWPVSISNWPTDLRVLTSGSYAQGSPRTWWLNCFQNVFVQIGDEMKTWIGREYGKLN